MLKYCFGTRLENTRARRNKPPRQQKLTPLRKTEGNKKKGVKKMQQKNKKHLAFLAKQKK